ncbi:MAG: hypothetical protein NTZ74_03160 [Chloroflexi bacterium]|nr:hypothetical protein [Chloroflexota bacterium]
MKLLIVQMGGSPPQQSAEVSVFFGWISLSFFPQHEKDQIQMK